MLLRAAKLVKSYDGFLALKGLDLAIDEGEVYCLLGANGAGKSTTLNLILGFIQPDRGTIQLSHSETKESFKSQELGYIPENVNLYPYLNGIENLNYFCKLAGLKYSREELSECLAECGLDSIAHEKRVSDYSKGMRQKVGIAIAYAKKAKVYLLDEPASGLDPVASNDLSVLLKKLASEGAAILMASHDLFRVRETCTHIGILKQGKLVKELDASEVTSNELEHIYLTFMRT